MRAKHVLLLPAIAAACVLAGCGNASQSETERQQTAEDYAASFGIDADVSTNPDGSERIEIRTGAGGVTGSNLAVPAGFPDDIPIYPGLNISTASDAGQGFVLQGQAPNGVDEVAQFYLAQMAVEGWTGNADQQLAPTMRTLQFAKAGRTANVNLIQNGPGTTVQLTAMGG